jgi:hypothetical protein
MSIASALSDMSATALPWLTELPIFPMADILIKTTPETATETATATVTEMAMMEVLPTNLPTTTTITMAVVTTTMLTSTTPRVIHTDVQGDCAPQPTGSGPVPEEDSMWGFYDSPEIHNAAANATTPPHYTQSFRFANASYVGAHYLGHFELESYDTLNCSARCDDYTKRAKKSNNETEGVEQSICQGINIYFERSPTIHLGAKCPNSKSRTIIKCALWGEELDPKNATNTGYTEWNFDVVIAGSNGYTVGEKGKESRGFSNTLAVGKGELVKKVVAGLMVTSLVWGLMGM